VADWITNEDLALTAHRLGTAVMAMYDKAGITVSVPAYPGGTPSPDSRETFINSFIADAEDFMSVEPQKVQGEFERMLGEGNVINRLGSTQGGALENANARLAANWHGAAADAFAQQMFNIQRFLDEQRDRILQAAKAMGTLYELSIEARRSYHNLAEATIAACEKEMDEQDKRDTTAQVGLLGEIVDAGLSLFSAEKLVQLLSEGIKGFTQIGAKTVEISLDASEAAEVVQNYLGGRDRLRESFDSGLHKLTKWIKAQDGQYRREPMPILEPLPVCVDITGPDFRYEIFQHEDRDPDTYSPKIEQQRAEITKKRQAEDSEISRRLNSDKGPV
jgi:uncharacterized protein YukE